MDEIITKSRVVPDPRTANWPLMEFKDAATVTLAYVVFVLVGRIVLRRLPKMELYWIRAFHNLSMTLLNFYMCIEIIRQQNSVGFWYGPIVRGPEGTGMAAVLWLFYVSKIAEFNDTIIMMFRHSYNQISFLHWYHHASVFMMWWFNVRYYPGGEAWPSAWLNSFVHVWMYGYYFLSTFGYQPWWKRYITQLQILQLSLFVVQGISLLYTGAQEFRFIGIINGIYAATLVALFMNFYSKSYSSRSKATKKE